jgi:hypothetical protein
MATHNQKHHAINARDKSAFTGIHFGASRYIHDYFRRKIGSCISLGQPRLGTSPRVHYSTTCYEPLNLVVRGRIPHARNSKLEAIHHPLVYPDL